MSEETKKQLAEFAEAQAQREAARAEAARNKRGAEGDTDRGAMSKTTDGKLERARANAERANYCTQCGHLAGGHYVGCPLITVKSSWTGVTDPHFYRSPAPLRSLTGAEEKLEPLSAQHQHDADYDCPAEEDYQDFDPKDYRCGTFAEPRADQCDECSRGVEHAMHCKIGIRNQQRALEILRNSDVFQPLNCSTCGVRSGYHAVGCPDAPSPATNHVDILEALRDGRVTREIRTNPPLVDDVAWYSPLLDSSDSPLNPDWLIPFGCGLLIGAVGCWVLTR